jgi:uncharacterized protein (TIGR02757 family)
MKRSIQNLKAPFETLYQTYSTSYLFSDPLSFVHQYKNPKDQEAVAFISSALAYGEVSQIFRILRAMLVELGERPADFLMNYDPRNHPHLFKGLYYRFHSARDLRLLIYFLSQVYQRENSLAESFKRYFSPQDSDVAPALTRWTSEVLELDVSPFYRRGVLPSEAPLRFFFSSPADGSSCKRLNLFLRWMVRGPDGLDLGLWNFIPPSKLVIPLDTHIYQIARTLKLTRRKSPNWKMAREITDQLKLLDPKDPVKYDFALTRIGILGGRRALEI